MLQDVCLFVCLFLHCFVGVVCVILVEKCRGGGFAPRGFLYLKNEYPFTLAIFLYGFTGAACVR